MTTTLNRMAIRLLSAGFILSCGMISLGARAPAQDSAPVATAARNGDPGSTGPDATSGVAADAVAGKQLYVQTGCSGCHGLAGQGGIGPMTGPRIGARQDDLPFEGFLYLIRNPVTAMPPYSEKVLTDAQARDIHAYLLSSFRPGRIKDIPMLDRQR